MATYAELQTYASSLVQDTDRLPANVSFGDLINQGALEIAGGMQSTLGDFITPPLPELLTINTINTATDAGYVSMPDNFQRDLQLVARSSGQEISIANSFINFTETYPLLNKSGTISEAIEHGNNFYYQGIPTSSEVLTIHYYRFSTIMSEDDHLPEGIPKHLQIPLLVNYAAWKANEFIEDGLEGEMPNTQKFMGLFLTALRTLELSIPNYTRGLMLR